MNEFRSKYAKIYLEKMKDSLCRLGAPTFFKKMNEIFDVLLKVREKGKTIFIMGNGGSATTASHFAGDLSKLTIVGDGRRFRVIALTDNVPQITAWANDQGYEDIFVEQLKNLLEEDDVVIGISCSGNSMNVIKALEYANEAGALTIGFTGFDGGKLKDMAKIPFIAPCSNMQRCEDLHMLLAHLLSSMIRDEIIRDAE